MGQSFVSDSFTRCIALFAAILVGLIGFASHSSERSPARELAPAEAKRWTAAVKAHRTKDGSSIIEALRFAERMRPSEFKVGNFEVVYKGPEPDGVTIDYFIGLKRADVDVWTAFFEVKRDGRDLLVSPVQNDTGFALASDAIEAGRDALIRFVDEEYEQRCVEYGSRKKLC